MTAETAKPNAGSQPSSVRLGLTRDGRYLAAVVSNDTPRTPITSDWLISVIKQKGFGDLFILQQSIEKLVKEHNQNKPIPQAIPIAEKRDATATVSVAEDKMSASINVTKPYGGKKITATEIKNLLAQQGINFGIQQEVLAHIEKTQSAKNLPIALGVAAIKGDDTKFQSLLPNVKERKPKILENGMVDYRDFGEILTVPAGTKLMKRIPAKLGKPGHDVLGNVLEAEPGLDIPFAPKLLGIKFDDNDPNVLFAAMTGQPIFLPNGVNVENVMDLKNVDMSTGNIVFDGSIHVKGDVKAGMKIEVSGDVTVEGIIEASNIRAGGNITVRNSIIGHGELHNKTGELNENVVSIIAGGSIFAKICENVILKAGDRIEIKEQCAKCEIDAVNEIIIGGKGAKVGQILGGKARSGILIHARVVGSPAGLKTILEISVDEHVHEQLRKIEEELVLTNLELHRNRMQYAQLKTNTEAAPEILEKCFEKITTGELHVKKLNQEKEELKTKSDRVFNGKFVVEKTVHAGASLRIVSTHKAFNEDASGHTFKLEGNEII